jgi:probable rRNA maturation factor
VNVTVIDEQDDPLQPGSLVELARTVMTAEGLPGDTELALHLVDPAKMAELNERHMGRRGPTDVLSFPIEDLTPGRVLATVPGGPPPTIGDVVICPAVVRANAAASGADFEDELALMIVHGVLHLLGYDHVDDDDAELMEARERSLLAAGGRTRP